MKKLLKSAFSLALAFMLVFSLGTSAFAQEWDIAVGNITVSADTGGQTVSQGGGAATPDEAPIITGSSGEYTVTISASEGATADVTLSGVTIASDSAAPISVEGEGSVNIKLAGGNALASMAADHAGIEKSEESSLTISDNGGKADSLIVIGGENSAGIGGGNGKSGTNITITGGTIHACSDFGEDGRGAGIGGGAGGDGTDISISGGNVTACSGAGAGIGGGAGGNGTDITISGGVTDAKSSEGGAGIGGGAGGNGTDITISGGNVTASGSGMSTHVDDENTTTVTCGAGIGGGSPKANATGGYSGGNAKNISISGGTVNAQGYIGGAGIGGGAFSVTDHNTETITASKSGTCENVSISGSADVTAIAGNGHENKSGLKYMAAGTPIGSGANGAIPGKAVTPDTSKLNTKGKLVLMQDISTILETIIGTYVEPVVPEASAPDDSSAEETSSSASASLSAQYYVVEGEEQAWLTGSADGLCFKLSSDKVIKVLIDGEEVEFELNESGEIVISSEVLQTLEAGEHEIEFIFADGSCKTKFTVK